MIIIEVSLYCCDKINKQILAQIHTSLCYIYCHLATFYLVCHLKKRLNDNKYNSGLCVFVQNLLIYHNSTMKPQL